LGGQSSDRVSEFANSVPASRVNDLIREFPRCAAVHAALPQSLRDV